MTSRRFGELARAVVDRHNRAVTNQRSRVKRRYPTAVLVATLFFAVAAHADELADGRRHAQRAGNLAASGKCKQALGEYDKAIATLHDPALLFNRGECHRKLGDATAALVDYRQFLADLPAAPNRAHVETLIADLKRTAAAGTESTKTRTDASHAPAAPPPSAKAGEANPQVNSNSRSPVAAAASRTMGGTVPQPAPSAVGLPPLIGDPTGTSDGPGGLDLIEPTPTLVTTPDRGPARAGASVASRPWFWVAVAAVVAGVGVGTYLLVAHDGTSVPQSELGNYRF